MFEPIETRIVVSGADQAEVRRTVQEFLEQRPEYDLRAGEEVSVGMKLSGYRDTPDADSDLHMSVYIGDKDMDYPDSVLVTIYVSAGVLEETTDLDGAPLLWSHVAATKDLYELLSDKSVAAHGVEGLQGVLQLISGATTPPTREYVSWLDIYPPEEVTGIGRNHLLSAPVPHVEELDDSAVVIVAKHPLAEPMDTLEAYGDHVGIPPWTAGAL